MTHSFNLQGGTLAKALAICGAAVLALLVFSGQALASAPTGAYAIFSDCPYENELVKQCNYSETTGGEVKLGNTRAPITNKILLQGGTRLNFETEVEEFFAAKDGKTLSKAAQPVEGGLAGLVPKSDLPELLWPTYEAAFENGVSGVNAVTELALPATDIGINASNLAAGEGIALTLPVKVHLENPFLGTNCYIGSSAEPIYLKLTDGTTSPPSPNKPISGTGGEFEFAEEGAILKETGSKLVDNSFAAPAATGCGGLLSAIVNPIVNTKAGLPAAAGKNTAILTGNLERGYAPAVRESVK